MNKDEVETTVFQTFRSQSENTNEEKKPVFRENLLKITSNREGKKIRIKSKWYESFVNTWLENEIE